MHCISAKFVPRLLTDGQKENRFSISQDMLANTDGDKNFLKNVITGDETWVYNYDVKTKIQSSQWMRKRSPGPKKALMSQSNFKVLLIVFFDWKGISITCLYPEASQ